MHSEFNILPAFWPWWAWLICACVSYMWIAVFVWKIVWLIWPDVCCDEPLAELAGVLWLFAIVGYSSYLLLRYVILAIPLWIFCSRRNEW